MMAHYQNTERLQALLKKHQSENSPTFRWFLYFQGWNLESLPCSDWLGPTSECTPLSTGSQRLLTCIPLHWLYGAGFTLLNGLIFNIFFFFTLLTINRQRKCCWLASPHEPCASASSPSPLLVTPPDLQLSASQRSHQLNYWGRQAALSTSIADAQLPTGLSGGHKRPDLRPLAGRSYSRKPPTALIFLCAIMGKLQKEICRSNFFKLKHLEGKNKNFNTQKIYIYKKKGARGKSAHV